MTKEERVRPYIYAYLGITGGDWAKEITKLVGAIPDQSSDKSDPIIHRPRGKSPISTGRTRKWASWQIYGRPRQYSFDVEWYISAVLARIGNSKSRIAALDRRRFGVSLNVVVYMHKDGPTPLFGLSSTLIRHLAAMRVPVDIDTYLYEEHSKSILEALNKFKGTATPMPTSLPKQFQLPKKLLTRIKPTNELYHLTNG